MIVIYFVCVCVPCQNNYLFILFFRSNRFGWTLEPHTAPVLHILNLYFFLITERSELHQITLSSFQTPLTPIKWPVVNQQLKPTAPVRRLATQHTWYDQKENQLRSGANCSKTHNIISYIVVPHYVNSSVQWRWCLNSGFRPLLVILKYVLKSQAMTLWYFHDLDRPNDGLERVCDVSYIHTTLFDEGPTKEL